MNARDIAIRTILGEAANESPMGQAAVLHVMMNRARDPRWPSGLAEVALQPKQFSAWNTGVGGNDLVRQYGPESEPYQRVAAVYDSVMSGAVPDPTGGATHYYSPVGMEALVSQGAQSNITPRWLQEQNAMRGGQPVTIDGHIFTGLAAGNPYQAPQQATEAPSGLMDALDAFVASEAAESLMATGLAGYAPPPPMIAPMQSIPIAPSQRDSLANYAQFFRSV